MYLSTFFKDSYSLLRYIFIRQFRKWFSKLKIVALLFTHVYKILKITYEILHCSYHIARIRLLVFSKQFPDFLCSHHIVQLQLPVFSKGTIHSPIQLPHLKMTMCIKMLTYPMYNECQTVHIAIAVTIKKVNGVATIAYTNEMIGKLVCSTTSPSQLQ